ncbi:MULTISPECIES: hypothetical protein [Pseudomonas]|jgi:hypothetical protein|uniref:Uncharacterized protein n=2 Tax=Pseudomonas TaxID=286 RepID=A0A7X1GJH7_9PSED|nr:MULTISPECIES: hypothetical protein [Pseudomonas]MBC2693514.1 hypothetical protein [Pseudomonas kielensis]MDD1011089.1 hypothetical protein [Pseudomonas shahriarae]
MPKIIDQGRDAFEFLTHDQADRTGIACARIARSLAQDVDPEALAVQLTANERKNNPANPETVTVDDVHSAAKLHRLNSRRQVYPQTQAAELEKVANQQEDYHPVYQN